MKRKIFKNVCLQVEDIVGEMKEKLFYAGKLCLYEGGRKGRFCIYKPRPRGPRNTKVYDSQQVRIMQCPDGSYVMTARFNLEDNPVCNVIKMLKAAICTVKIY